MIISPQLCELIGAIIGDGNIYCGPPYYVEITGHPQLDKDYFESFLIPTITKELNYSPKLSLRWGARRIRINNKNFVDFLIGMGIPYGKDKFRRVTIPDKILFSSHENLNSCIRGIFDTDGCAHFDMREAYKRPYIRIELHMQNRRLLLQIQDILKRNCVPATIPEKKETMYINGCYNVRKYLENIGFRNQRHLNRIHRKYPELINFNKPR